jgi:phosphoribosylformylglycinamidine cyclo-ligase
MLHSGFNIDLGDACSKTAYNWAKRSFSHRAQKSGSIVSGLDGSFSNLLKFGKEKIAICSDGIGTKIEVAERLGVYETLGFDLTAMVVDDLAANGFVPTNLSNILDVDRLDPEIVHRLMKGLYLAAKEARIAVTGGEIAELGSRISGFGEKMHFNWCATAIGYLPAKLPAIDGRRIKPGDAVLALHSASFRSNGYSLLRKILTGKFGAGWHQAPYNSQQTWGQVALIPSQIFSSFIGCLRQNKIELHGLAHITGGGLVDNFRRILKSSGCGAGLANLPPPPPFMLEAQALGSLTDREAYRYWNMGVGMVLVTPSQNIDAILRLQQKLFKKIGCSRVGEITRKATIQVVTKGANSTRLSENVKIKIKQKNNHPQEKLTEQGVELAIA